MNFFTLFLLTRSILFHEYVNYIYIYIINDDFMWIKNVDRQKEDEIYSNLAGSYNLFICVFNCALLNLNFLIAYCQLEEISILKTFLNFRVQVPSYL